LELLRRVGETLKVEVQGVPFTVIGERYVVGYLNDETQGRVIEEEVKSCLEGVECEDVVDSMAKEIAGVEAVELGGKSEGIPPDFPEPITGEVPMVAPLETLKLPFLGEMRIENWSLPVLTIVIGGLDGFNPCAMWVLVFLISLLLGMKDRRRMWILGGAFILASGLVYFLFLSAWLNLFLFLGLVIWVRILVGLVALGAGGWSLWDFWTNKEGACKVTEGEKRKKTFEKLKDVVSERRFLVALVGIVLLAVAVNMVELVCSAGLPAVYTQVLAMNQLATWQYYLYLGLYILVFMLDDMLVFGVAMVTLKMTGLEGKYARWSRLIGGVIMLGIGVAMLVRPEWLMFGG
jgi:hypothetical protein